MKKSRLCSLAAALAVTVANTSPIFGASAWLQYGYTPAHTSFNNSEATLTRDNVSQLAWVWSGKTGRSVGSAPIFGPTSVFVAVDGRIISLRAHGGQTRWAHLSCSGEGTVQPALGHHALLVADGGGDLAAYDPATGDQIWCDDESGSITSASAAARGRGWHTTSSAGVGA